MNNSFSEAREINEDNKAIMKYCTRNAEQTFIIISRAFSMSICWICVTKHAKGPFIKKLLGEISVFC